MQRSIIILAAGRGSRIQEFQNQTPKPLIVCGGKTLIERNIESAKTHGFNHFVIVLGHQGAQIQEHLGDGSKLGVEIDYVYNQEWEKNNGVSVLKAKVAVRSEESILLMSDHILEPSFFELIQEIELGQKYLCLLVDYKIDEIFDMDDATKVLEQDGLIVKINKKLEEFNCIDTGVFVISQNFFSMLEKEYKTHGDVSISQGVQALVEEKKAGVHNVGHRWWQDVDTSQAFGHAETLLSR